MTNSTLSIKAISAENAKGKYAAQKYEIVVTGYSQEYDAFVFDTETQTMTLFAPTFAHSYYPIEVIHDGENYAINELDILVQAYNQRRTAGWEVNSSFNIGGANWNFLNAEARAKAGEGDYYSGHVADTEFFTDTQSIVGVFNQVPVIVWQMAKLLWMTEVNDE